MISVEADILMGNISLPENTMTVFSGNGDKKRKEIVPSRQRFYLLTQFFSTSFQPTGIDSIPTPVSGKDPSEMLIRKSGNPGYNKGKPLLSALYTFEGIEDIGRHITFKVIF